jgi:crotonobetainyl-CoA:carnitine CoA-transferase CaiB-like acyl-CoA transferase
MKQLEGPLAGVRVIDLTIARAGPTCVRALGDLGADVIQLWHPHHGDLGGSDALNLHRGKRSILVDLKTEAGREVLLRLSDASDVLVENFRPDVKRRLRIGPDRLRERNPRLIYASLSGYGQDGPYANRPCVDQIAQGMGGLMSVTGPPGDGPWRAGIAISDTAAGTLLTQGVLAALYARERTGEGQWVRTSLLEAMISHREALREAIERRLAERPTDAWVERINDAGIPCGPVLRLDEVFADPQVQHLQMAARVQHETAGSIEVIRHPVSLDETPVRVRGAAPLPGADTLDVLRELAYSDAEIEALISTGAAAKRSQASEWGTRGATR